MIRTMTKKLVLLITLATLILTSCGNEQGDQTQSPIQQATQASLTLRFGVPYGGLFPYFAPEIERFEEANPAITVEISVFVPNGPLAYANAETNVDVFLWPVLSDPLVTYEGKPSALNLQPFVSAESQGFSDADFFPGQMDAFRWQGDLYGIPADNSLMVLYYNRAIFDATDVPYPQAGWTWQDFLDISKTFTTIAGEGERQTGQWGFICQPEAGEAYLFLLQHGGVMFDDPLNPTRFVPGDPRVVEALQWYGDLAQTHHVCPTPNEMQRYQLDPSLMFALGKAAMYISYVSEGGGNGFYNWPWSFSWGATPLPRDASEATWSLPAGYFISAQSTHPQEAWAFVKYLSEQSQYGYRKGVPARRSIAESDAYRQRVGEELAAAAINELDSAFLAPVPASTVALGGRSPNYDQLWANFLSSSVNLLNGDTTVENMLMRLKPFSNP